MSNGYTLESFKIGLEPAVLVSITTIATLHTRTADVWANFERIIGKRVAKRL